MASYSITLSSTTNERVEARITVYSTPEEGGAIDLTIDGKPDTYIFVGLKDMEALAAFLPDALKRVKEPTE